MFVLLSKLLPILVYPASLAGILLLLALRARSSRWRLRFLAGAVGVVWILGNGWVAGGLLRSLEWRYLPQENYPQVDAIVILGGGTAPANFPRTTVEVDGAGDRVIYGAALYRQGLAPTVILTGGNLPWTDSADTPAGEMQGLLLGMGVPAEAMILETGSDNTYENAVNTWALAEPLGIRSILLVTSARHMPRSVPLFETVGFTVIPAPTDFTATARAGTRPLSETWPDLLLGLFPDAGAMMATTSVMKEYIGMGVYWLRGWYR